MMTVACVVKKTSQTFTCRHTCQSNIPTFVFTTAVFLASVSSVLNYGIEPGPSLGLLRMRL